MKFRFFGLNALLISRIAQFALAMVLIVIIFPKEGKFRYEYNRGKPWMHNDLIAPFDFPIYKSDAEINQEKETALQSLRLVFIFNDKLLNQNRIRMYDEFRRRVLLRHGDIPPHYERSAQRLNHLFDTVHDVGIIEMHQIIEGQPENFNLVVLRNHFAETVELGQLFNIRSAEQFIRRSLTEMRNEPEADLIERLVIGYMVQNILYDDEKTEQEKQAALGRIMPTRGMIQRGERIISTGDLVNAEKMLVLDSYRREHEAQFGSPKTYLGIVAGQVILVSISMTVFFLFLLIFRPNVFQHPTKVIFLLLNLLLMVILTSYVVRNHPDFINLIPLCLIPIIVRIFFDTRLALFVHLVTIIITGFLVPNSFEFVFLQLIAGIIAIISVVRLIHRSQFMLSALLILLTYSTIYIGMNLMQTGDFSALQMSNIFMFAGSAFLTLLAYPLIYIFEKSFGFITDLTLLELSDTNNTLLRQLSEKAPGTFQHSLQVANIAEEIICEIGGNPLLVRTGALYHDIGKMNTPQYFIENQSTGVNPHDEMPFAESARIIIGHMIKGIELARKHNLPDAIIDFIRTHHGTKKVEYFFLKQRTEFPDEKPDEEVFSYRGPLPYSRETAAVMMADSVEAASRGLPRPDQQNLSDLVESVINKQVEAHQFDNSPITLYDISRIKKILKKKLMNIYHVRIEYQGI